jgi:hypothetical protein
MADIEEQRAREADAANQALRDTIGECRELLRRTDERLSRPKSDEEVPRS